MIKGKILVKGKIKTLSPALIGSGEDEWSDIDVLLDSDDIPFITATSLIGVLRHYIDLPGEYKDKLSNFWGFARYTEGKESAINCSDLLCLKNFGITIRDGIRIDNTKGIVEDKGKFDYQVLEKGAEFSFKMICTYTDDTEVFVKQMMATICSLLEGEKIHVGAKTNNGLGKIKLVDKKIYNFDFTKKDDVFKWLKNELPAPLELKENAFNITKENFSIDAIFDLKDSLIIRSYPSDPDSPDAVHIKSGDDPVIPGSSLKGAIRARAERILKTLGKDEKISRKLFGYVDDKLRSKDAMKGKLRVEEVILPKFAAEINTRIKIDRFTGGTIEAALFDTVPLYTNFNDKVKNVRITVRDCKDYEAGLILLVLKDLWSGDLAVGGEKNTGRGVFEGYHASITWGKDTIKLERNLVQTSIGDQNKLEALVRTLVNFNEGGNN